MLPVRKAYGVDLVEQPVPPDDLEGLAAVRRRGVLPVIADESCLVAGGVGGFVGAGGGINIKRGQGGAVAGAPPQGAPPPAPGALGLGRCRLAAPPRAP